MDVSDARSRSFLASDLVIRAFLYAENDTRS